MSNNCVLAPYIGDIPKEWALKRIKHIVISPVTTGAGEEAQFYEPGFIRYIRISDFDKSGKIIPENAVYIPLAKGSRYILSSGDILAATAGATVGKTLLFTGLDEPACYAGYLARIRVNPSEMLNKFLLYQMQSQIMDGFRVFYVKKSTIENISASSYSNMPVVVPPLSEQHAIVRYLDSKCSAIDEAIERHKKIIEKLEEHRKASAFNAVTKGISHSTLKPSGEEWLGNIPEHWSVQRNWTLFKEVNERGNDNLPILTVSINSGISDRELSDDESDRIFVRSADKSKYKRVQPGDIAYNMMRAWQGAFGAARVEGMVSPAYVTVRPITNIDSRYYEYLMRSDSASQEFEKYSRGITDFRLRLYYSEFSNIKVCVPPLAEQKEIADYLDDLYKKTDIAVTKVNAIITKLEEYRKSLIYNAVTGKIDCRTEAAG